MGGTTSLWDKMTQEEKIEAFEYYGAEPRNNQHLMLRLII